VTEFTDDSGLDDDKKDADEYHFAFVCPRCEEKNALIGDPLDFANKPFRCLTCNYVPLLDAGAIEEFAEEVDA